VHDALARRSAGRDSALAGRLITLLSRGPAEHACAAALVLGALRLDDPRVSRALARRLSSAHAPLRPYVREALARQRSDEGLRILVGGLLGTGVEREQSRRLVVSYGARALACFDRVLAADASASGSQFFDAAAAMRTRAAIDWSLRHLAQAAAARALAIGRALRREVVASLERPLRARLRAQLLALIRRGRFESGAAVRVAFALLETLGPAPRVLRTG
jgi:hypothetical protein